MPVWRGCVATTFDFAGAVVVVDVEQGRELGRREEPLRDLDTARRVRRLVDLGVGILVCGAISRPAARRAACEGLRVVPLVSGTVDDVLGAYLCGRLDDPAYLLPGCGPGARRRWRHGARLRGGGES